MVVLEQLIDEVNGFRANQMLVFAVNKPLPSLFRVPAMSNYHKLSTTLRIKGDIADRFKVDMLYTKNHFQYEA